MKLTLADTIFSTYIRTRAGWNCQRCGKHYEPPTKALHCAHYHSRGHWATRYHADNAISLCYGCHRYIDGHQAVKDELFEEILGKERFSQLLMMKQLTIKDMKHTKKSIQKWARAEYRQKIQELVSCESGGF